MVINITGVYLHMRPALVRGLERYSLEQSLHDGMQSSGADILRSFVDMIGDFCDSSNTALDKLQADILGGKQRFVLRCQRRVRFRQDANEVFGRERLQLHANGKPAL